MPSNAGVAFGAIAQSLGQALSKKKEQAYEEEKRRQDLVNVMVTEGMKSGQVDPNEAMQFLVSGGAAKGKKPLPAPFTRVINAVQQAAGGPTGDRTMGGQAKPSFVPQTGTQSGLPRFKSASEMAQAEEDAKIRYGKRFSTEVTLPEKTAESKLAIERDAAKPYKGVADKEPSKNPDGTWSIKVRDAADGSILYEQPSQGPKPKTPLDVRQQELEAQGIPADRSRAVAAKQIADERGTKMQQAADRLDASLKLSRQALLTNEERYAEMKQMFPHLLAAKIAGEELAPLRVDLLKKQLAKADQASPEAGAVKEASKIVDEATKFAEKVRSKRGVWDSVLNTVGLGGDDPDTVFRNYIQERSGGQDPDAIIALSRQATAPKPTTPSAKPAAGTPTYKKNSAGQFVISTP